MPTTQPEQFIERRDTCQAMLLTEDNGAEVAAWCDGNVIQGPGGDPARQAVTWWAGDTPITARVGDRVVLRPGADFVRIPAAEFDAQWMPNA
ncbi:hypothetical protein QE370_000464 [Aeromicrobium sp. SORGH_AS981]|uniref:hypothetical protein n=1 Tax=Aeromicrobium sp. SORGH_AS_0981 TaxID=3041802 RepID=UPI00285FF54C|nr:hypothetical protein [Aeromicrobium sp. SORGH_AS_0981]MDR6117280.1 hypothetical protein [Aeromicrobium sp. SORGH_AS_0981]